MIREGDWCQSRTGRQLFPWDMRVEDLCATDIAYGLREPRFASQTIGKELYSVAEHSVRCSQIVPPEHAMAALMHDAHEFIFKDIPAPIKRHPCLSEYVAAQERLQEVINRWCGLEPGAHLRPVVKHADLVMLATEKRDLMSACEWSKHWQNLPQPLGYVISPWIPECAAQKWLDRFVELTGMDFCND